MNTLSSPIQLKSIPLTLMKFPGFHLKTRIEQLYNTKEVTEQINH